MGRKDKKAKKASRDETPSETAPMADVPETDTAPQEARLEPEVPEVPDEQVAGPAAGPAADTPSIAHEADADPSEDAASTEVEPPVLAEPLEATVAGSAAPSTDIDEPEEDEFAATREVIADPDAWRMERRKGHMEISAGEGRKKLAPEELKEAKKYRLLTHVATATSALLVLTALGLHVAGQGPTGLDTWLMTLALGAFFGAAWVFPKARFESSQPTGTAAELARSRYVRDATLRTFGVGFGVFFAIIAFLEVMALFVALGWIADLSQSQVTLAKHFVFIPAIALTALIAATYVRMRIPTFATRVPHEEKVIAASLALFAFSSVVAIFFSLGLPAVVKATEVEARQGIYIATIGLLSALAIGTIRLRYPDAVRIIIAEVERAKQVDRRSAETMHKKMLRNYVLALVFVVGSIGFLVSKAAGLIDTEKSGGLDLVLLVYLGLGLLFLGTVLMHFFQAKQINRRVILPKKGQALGKRRYRPEEVTLFVLLGVSGFFAVVFMTLAVFVGMGKIDALGPFEVTRAHATDFGVFAILSGIGPYGFYYSREASRIHTIDEKFPDFLRDLAESQRAGMTLPKALLTASKGVYGPLTKEIQIMAAQVEWGVSFSEALRRFAERTRTPLIERTVSLVIEASASGGNVVDILAAASDDAREIKNILVERKQQMSVYSMIIYIAFGVFLTVITVLNSQFIPQLAGATSQVAGTSLGGIQFGDIDVPHYQRLFWHAALIQGIGGGLVSGVMTEGHPYSGLRHSFFMTFGAYAIFRFVIM